MNTIWEAGRDLLAILGTDVFLSVARQEAEFYKASENLLRSIHSGRIKGATPATVLAEAKIALYERGEVAKGDKLASLIEEIVSVIPVDREIAEQSAELKFKKGVTFFAAIQIVTASLLRGTLVTRDLDLKRKVGDIVEIKTPEEVYFLAR